MAIFNSFLYVYQRLCHSESIGSLSARARAFTAGHRAKGPRTFERRQYQVTPFMEQPRLQVK